MTYPLPRYNPRVAVTITFPDTGDEGDEQDPFVWFASFEVLIDLSARWPISTTVLRQALGPLGLPSVRRK